MSLKVKIDGETKVVASRRVRPVVFVNGEKKRLTKGVVFVNGEKKYLWGNESIIEMLNFTWDVGYPDLTVVYIDENDLIVFGDLYAKAWSSGSSIGSGGRLPVTPSYRPAGWVYILQSDNLDKLDISNLSSVSDGGRLAWGNMYNLFSPEESDENKLVWYSVSTATRNRIVYDKTDRSFVVSDTYSGTGQSTLAWCVPLPNGKNLWGVGSTLGYNSTTVSTSATITYPVWDGTNVVFTSSGKNLYRCDVNGCTQIVAAANLDVAFHTVNQFDIYPNKMADGDNLLVVGYNDGTYSAKIIKFDKNGNRLWERVVVGDSSTNKRRLKLVCKSGGVYYVLDEPETTSEQDQTVYLRLYSEDGGVLGVERIYAELPSGERITEWGVLPRRIESDYAGLWYFDNANDKAYVCRIFVG